MDEREALNRLKDIEHVVVLMKENRSFDQMLGYLKRDGMPEVNGLTGEEVNHDAAGNSYPVFEWGPADTVFHPDLDPTGKVLDPCHTPACVREQLSDGNSGFVTNFLATRKDRDGNPVQIPDRYRGMPMGYYSATHLPVYDHLARQYCVCDAWHASIPGDTWPNRLYSLAGRAGESIGHKPGLLSTLLRHLRGIPRLAGLPTRRSSRSRPSPASSRSASGAGTPTTRRPCAGPTSSTATSPTSTATTSPTSTASGSAP